jgi:pimeloyl-ACP methyl ester carboxylesterase
MTSDLQTPVERSVVSPDGTSIAYWCTGSGRPLVLLHGTSANHTRWRSVLHLLEPHVTVCAVDRRGRGGSGDAEDYEIEREFDDVAAVVDVVARDAGEPVDLFGHSYGAVCAIEGALRTAGVRRLVLYEPPFAYDSDASSVVERLEALLAEGRREEMVETFFREVAKASEEDLAVLKSLPAWQARVDAAHTILREERVGFDYRFQPERFSVLEVPTLLLEGSRSPDFLRRSTAMAAAALPDAEVVTLEGQQHVAMDTAPEMLAGAVLAFLER